MEIERTVTIRYRWWRDGEIKKKHIEALEETAMEKIIPMMNEGFMSGELNDNIYMLDDDPEDGVEYSGWWKIRKEERE